MSVCAQLLMHVQVRRCGREDYKYAVMIDDDVPIPPDFYVPREELEAKPHIKAVCYGIRATTPEWEEEKARKEGGNSGCVTGCGCKEPLLVALQDAEYKVAGMVKQLQWKGGSTLCAHGAISLWRRDILGEVFRKHDTEFHGEDQYVPRTCPHPHPRPDSQAYGHTLVTFIRNTQQYP